MAVSLVFRKDFPIIQLIEHLFSFTAAESCGKMFSLSPWLNTRQRNVLDEPLMAMKKVNKVLLKDLLTTMESGSLCALGGGLPLPINNALEYFFDELQDYFSEA